MLGRRTHAVALGVALLAACRINDADEPGRTEVPVTIAPTAQWCGNEVRVTSARYVGLELLPVFRAGATAVYARRLDDSTLAVATAELPCGTYELTETFEDETPRSLGTITLHGFTRLAGAQPDLYGDMVVWSRTGEVIVVGGNREGLGLVYPRTDRLVHYPGVGRIAEPGRLQEPGLSYDHNIVLVTAQDETGSELVQAWRLLPSPTLVTTYSLWRGPARQLLQLSPTLWLVGWPHDAQTVSPAGVRATAWESGPSGLRLSPRRDRATVTSNGTASGHPVFDAVSGELVYEIASIWRGTAAEFSFDGDTLYIAGHARRWYEEPVLKAVRAADGLSIATVPLPTEYYAFFSMALDPEAPLLYVGAARRFSGAPVLLVYDRRDLSLVATLKVPEAPENVCSWACDGGVVAVDGNADEVFIVSGANVQGTHIYHFSLPPTR
ncbi:MAG TPA: hypothetical protein VNK43_06005 [Gemmatimonadales bacterium]|nr:hypothetical protein [Gemmatimonadales bacterium]